MKYYKVSKKLILQIIFCICITLVVWDQKRIQNHFENTKRESVYEKRESVYEKRESVYDKIKSTAYDDPNVDFSMYVDKFYRDLDIYCHYPTRSQKMIIKFADIDKIKGVSNINAVSYGVGNDELIEIYVNPSFWKKARRAQKYWLMYHELSHDVLNIDDLDAVPENVGKLMYPQMGVMDVADMDEFIEAFNILFDSL